MRCLGWVYTFSSVKYLATKLKAIINVIEFPKTLVAVKLTFSKAVSIVLYKTFIVFI